MNLPEQIAAAIAAYLQTQSVANSPAIQSGISAAVVVEEISRVVVVGNEAALRKSSLPGLYDVSGTVNVIQALDDDQSEIKFAQTCDSINHILGGKYGMPCILQNVDPQLKVFSYQWLGNSLAVGGGNTSRQFLASYQWTAFASNTPITTT